MDDPAAAVALDTVLEPTAIAGLGERVGRFLREAGVDETATHHSMVALEELLINAARHGRAAGTLARAVVEMKTDRVEVTIEDQGAPFDPAAVAVLDLSVPLKDRPLGGMGLVLVKGLTEGVSVERIALGNRTRFSVRRSL